jgi:hypothetical protein
MSRLKTRVPGRYERPAELRPPLGDQRTEQRIRAYFRSSVRELAGQQRAERAAVTLTRELIDSGRVTVVDEPPAGEVATVEAAPGAPRVQLHPLWVDAGDHAETVARLGRLVATIENAGTLAVAKRGALPLRESVGGAIAEAPKDTASGRMVTIDVIRSGWNSSGSRYYGADVLERDVPKVYGPGTQMYIDHPSATEGDDRPERSLQTLAGVFTDTPWAVREADGTLVMRTTARVFGPWQPLIREAWEAIGVSINGNGRGDYGTAEGREGLIIEELTYGRSVDFVTVPGAGGRVLGLLESDRPFDSEQFRGMVDAIARTREAGTLGAYVESRIHLGFTELGDELYGGGYVNRPERITLSGAIGDALGAFVSRVERDAPQLYQRGRYAGPTEDDGGTVTAEAAAVRTREATVEQSRAAIDRALAGRYAAGGGYCWVQDFDPDFGLVWFTARAEDDTSRTYQQSYITSGGEVHLTGERVEVRARTVYEPVARTTEAAAGRRLSPGGLVDLDALERHAAAERAARETTPPAPAGEVSTTETTAGDPPAASNDGPTTPANTTKESDMGEKSPEVVAREAAEARATSAELELARYRAGDAARPVIDALLAEAGELADLTKTRVRESFPAADLPLTADNALDEAKLRESVTARITKEKDYAAQLLEAAGAGTVRNNGAASGAGTGAPAGVFGGTRTTTEAAGDEIDAETREALIKQFMANKTVTREAAERAVDGR